MNIMTKRGNHDNIVTYEHICDRHADLANIPAAQATLGSVAIVLKDEGDVLGVYMCNSEQEWSLVGDMSGGGGGSGAEIHICTNDEIDATTGLPSIENPQSNTFYLVPGDQVSGDMYEEYIWVNEAWEKFGSGGGSGGAQADWNQNTVSAPDYVKNRTHWEENGGTTFFDTGNETINVSAVSSVKLANKYWTDSVVIDFSKKINIVSTVLGINATNVESHQYYDDDYGDTYQYYSSTGEWDSANNQWVVFYNGVDYWFNSSLVQGDNQDIDLKLSYNESSIHKLDPKFYEQADWNENDATSGAYIKNRICYDASETIYDGVSVNFGTLENQFQPYLPESDVINYDTISEGDSYILTIDDVVFDNCLTYLSYPPPGAPFPPAKVIAFNDDKTSTIDPNNTNTIQVTIGYPNNTDPGMIVLIVSTQDDTYAYLFDDQNHTIKLSKNSIKTIDAKYLTKGQGDWNESNTASAAYIKNRTHFVTTNNLQDVGVNDYNFSLQLQVDWYAATLTDQWPTNFDETISSGAQIEINGVQKVLPKQAFQFNGYAKNGYVLYAFPSLDNMQNAEFITFEAFGQDYQFSLIAYHIGSEIAGQSLFSLNGTNTITIKIGNMNIQKLDSMYLPDGINDWESLTNKPNITAGEGTNSIVENGINPSYNNGTQSHAEGIAESGTKNYLDTITNGNATFSTKVPTVTGGSAHHIEGNSHLIENSNFVHIEGDTNRINGGTTNHVEGMVNYARSHSFGHVEGDNNWLQSGNFSHVEGYLNTAGGTANHVEGYNNTSIKGVGTHIEGMYNTITANVDVIGMHLEGVCCTISDNTEGMHVGGRANSTSSGYAEVIGNGTYTSVAGGVSNIVRSDARRLDWNGNEWIAGSITAAGGSLTIGSTTITEAQLQALLAQLS